MAARRQHIQVDQATPLAQQADTGHNRWHEEIVPILEVEPGERVVLDTRDAFDGQLSPSATNADVGRLNLGPVHPLTGPVSVKGAMPGDLLEVKLLEIECDPWDSWGYTLELPGFGFLRDLFPEPYIAHWHLVGDYAESPQIPGVRVPAAPFPGILGLAPSNELREAATRREAELAGRGGVALPPLVDDAVHPHGAIAEQGLRTVPPRETGGNLDIKQLTPGASLFIPVYVEGGHFSTGDVHFAQGDCEACGTAIEIRSRVHVEFQVHPGEARRRNIRDVQFLRNDYFTDPLIGMPRRCFATTGMPVHPHGVNESEDLTLAARNALINMIDHLGTRGYDPQQAYALCSVAVDLRISQVVDVPNFIVSALLPLDIFV